MPIYEYYCPNCEILTEVLQKISDKKETFCKNCSQHSLIKKTSLNSFQLKGSGWYKDAYENKKVKKDIEKTAEKKTQETSSKETASKEPQQKDTVAKKENLTSNNKQSKSVQKKENST